jgi:serine/threonine-protein kinase
MNIDPQEWRRLFTLLDRALTMNSAEQATWLEEIARTESALLEPMQKLLAQHARIETHDILSAPPDIAAALRADAAKQSQEELHQGAKLGSYTLLRELGRGGMGAVWLGERSDGKFTRQVALKFPYAGPYQRQLAERLARERDILAGLEHPNIARMYDFDVTPSGQSFLILEYVDGMPIDVYCNQHQLTTRQRLELFLQVLTAVQYAHSRLVIHRDLKPSNILVTSDGMVRLLDFGIAKLIEQGEGKETMLTQLGGRALTPDFASPEQILGHGITTASDIYSLGVVLYQLLTGSRPYRLKRDNRLALEEAIAEADVLTPSQVPNNPQALNKDIDAILLKALRKDTALRYATAESFREDIERLLDGRAVLAQSNTSLYRLKKFVQRNLVPVAAGGIVVCALVIGLSIALWQARIAKQQAARAEQVKDFVLSIFRDADTDSGAGKETTANELLRQAQARLASQPVKDNATMVELLISIGYALAGLEDNPRAIAVLDEAVRLGTSQLGESHPQTAAANLALGEALFISGDNHRAKQVIDLAEKQMRSANNPVGLMHALRWKSSIAIGAGNVPEGVAFAQEAVHIADTQPTDIGLKDRMEAYGSLTNALESAKAKHRAAVALRHYELAREVYGARSTENSLIARVQYATALIGEGDAGAALKELQAVTKEQVPLLGHDHGDVAYTYFQIGNAATATGDMTLAIDAFREAVRINNVLSAGKPSPNRANSTLSLGLALANAKQFAAAEAEMLAAEKDLLEFVDGKHWLVRNARSARAVAMARQGNLSGADSIFQELLLTPFVNELDTARIKGRLGILRRLQGRNAEAEPLLREAAEYIERNGEPRATATALAELGTVLLDESRFDKARDPLQKAWTLYYSSLPNDSLERTDMTVLLERARANKNE